MPTRASTMAKRRLAGWPTRALAALAARDFGGLQLERPRSLAPAPTSARRRRRRCRRSRSAARRSARRSGPGPVRIGIILPLTQSGAPSAIGVSMHNARATGDRRIRHERRDADDPRRSRHARRRGAGRAGRGRRAARRSCSGRCSPTTCAKSRRVAKPAGGRSSPSRPTTASPSPASISCRS